MSNLVEENKFITKKTTFQITNEAINKLEKIANKTGVTKSKIIDILIKKVELETIENEFDIYNIVCKKMK